MPEILKDFVFNVRAYLHWHDEYTCEGEWTCIKNMNNHLERVRELLPKVYEIIHNEDSFDGAC